jgi:hypothetical protein
MLRAIVRSVVVLAVAGLLAGSYIAYPFYTAWSLREAIKSRDVPAIERAIVWDSVRSSLRASLANHAQLLPEATAAGAALRPTMWQRVKSALGSTMLDRFMENYVTPEGLPKLFEYNQTWKRTVGAPTIEDDAKRPWRERVSAFIARVKRAEFQSLTKLELEMEDRSNADRRYLSVFELIGYEWKLTRLEILSDTSMQMERPRLRDLASAALIAGGNAVRRTN